MRNRLRLCESKNGGLVGNSDFNRAAAAFAPFARACGYDLRGSDSIKTDEQRGKDDDVKRYGQGYAETRGLFPFDLVPECHELCHSFVQ